MDEHLDPAALADMMSVDSPLEALERAYGHLAFCPECAARWHALQEVRGDFPNAWEEFVAMVVGAEAATPSARLESASTTHRFSFALPVFIDAKRKTARIGGALESLSLRRISVVSQPLLQGIGDGVEAPRVSAAEVRVEGGPFGAATVVADSRRNVLSILLRPPTGVSFDELRSSHALRAVLLASEGGREREAEFLLPEGADYLLAEFEALEQADWILGLDFEPAKC
jgi:hypothetical protein